MQRLFNIVRAFKEYVVLALLTILSLILLSLNDNSQIRTIRAYTVGFVGLLQSATSVIPNVFALERENTLLREQNVSLTDEVSRLREAKLENDRLRAMLGLKEHGSFHLVVADVVGKTLDLLRNTITLDAGENEGVKANMPIVSESGLVGRVIATSKGYAVGQLMMNKEFRSSAKVQRSRVLGILAWNGGEYLELRNVAKTQDVAVGDVVMTSEYSNAFPPNLRIGIVVDVTEHEGGLFKQIRVKPSVDLATVEHVFIVTAVPQPERGRLETGTSR